MLGQQSPWMGYGSVRWVRFESKVVFYEKDVVKNGGVCMILYA